MAHRLQATFMRGGTSRGLFFSGVSLAPFRQEHRDKIICSAMGSPDPGGRQIDGLGGGVSSLSKCAIVSTPGGGMAGIANKAGIPMPGSSAGDHKRLYNDPEEGWDVNYRFGQVPVNGTQVDWGSTCGNLVAAVSQFAIASRAFSQEKITERFVSSKGEVDLEHPTPEFILPMQIFAANVEKRILVKVPVIGERLDQGWNWSPKRSGDASIAGVPGTAAPIQIETPLETTALLPTGNSLDTFEVEGQQVDCTIINAGLATIFVSSSSPYLELSEELLLSHPSVLDSSPVMQKLQNIREAVCNSTSNLELSPSEPKICILAPSTDYTSTEGVFIKKQEMDCLVRAVSVGNVHRTIPATALNALACGLWLPNSTIDQAVRKSSPKPIGIEAGIHAQTISVGQPSGVSSATSVPDKEGKVNAVQMVRTAREIMRGFVSVPDGVKFDEGFESLANQNGRYWTGNSWTRESRDTKRAGWNG